jgi:Spy/CpxP family protein refolding chaperone
LGSLSTPKAVGPLLIFPGNFPLNARAASSAPAESTSTTVNTPPGGTIALAASGESGLSGIPAHHGGTRTMRNSLVTLALGGLLVMGLPAAARAQDNPQYQQGGHGGGHHGGMNPDRQLERMTRELGLTTDQQAQIKPLIVDHQQKMQALFQDQSIPEQDRRTQMRTMNEGYRNSVKAVLNDDQKQKFDAMQQHMHRGGPEGQGGGPDNGGAPPPPPQQPQQ